MRKLLLLVLCLGSGCLALAQSSTITGEIKDAETDEGLIGASVVLKGTTKGSVTDIAGKFRISNVGEGSVTLSVNYVGYVGQEVNVEVSGGTVTIDPIMLQSSSVGLTEVVISGMAIDRQTPVAVSTVKTLEIESKIGSQEFPEILKSTPGVFATKAGGGFGDGRVNVRGFDAENVAVLINGVPVNDMENGRVYWSNWAGLTDATNSIQVQRGLGASRIAVPSIGGTINIQSKASDREQGGNIYLGTGNNNYSKVGFTVSTGLDENGWAVTLSGSRTQGDGYVRGTEFLGFSYFANIAKKINDNHEITFTAVGAKQRHGQRQNYSSLEDYENSPDGIQYNPDWGILHGQVVHVEDNFYHKPQMSINHYWNISDATQLSTAVYASFGTGGGGGTGGDEFTKNTLGGAYGPIDLDYLVEQNEGTQDGNALAFLRASRNDHKWYGMLSSLDQDLGGGLSLMAGLDLRYYKGQHFREITNLLGADYFIDDSDVNDSTKAVKVGDKYDYHNDGLVTWGGLFAQLEYSRDKLSAFVTVNGSNTSYKRIDYFLYTPDDPLRETDWYRFFAYGVKGGANYNLTDNHNVFANVGYFNRAPFFDAVFPQFDNENINEDVDNQKIISMELGYGYRSAKLNVNMNVYRTEWRDRTYTVTGEDDETGEIVFGNLLGVNALHQGVEIDAVATPVAGLRLIGMLSLGDWTWQNDIENVQLYDESQNPVGDPVDILIAGLHVGNAAQTTAALGVQYEILPSMKLGLDYNYFDKLYAQFDPEERSEVGDDGENVESWKMPGYGTVDLNLIYDFDIAGFASSIYANVYNLTNTQYVADAIDGGPTPPDNPGHNASSARVYYGFGTTWNIGLKMRF